MPELPDVEIYRQYLNSTALHKQVRNVETHSAQVLDGIGSRKLRSLVKDSRVNETMRHGKHLFIRFGKSDWLAVHFGMTGYLAYYKDTDDQPEHAQVVFDLANNYHLAYVAPRKLGHLKPTDDPRTFRNREELGPDALRDISSADELARIMKGKRGGIKSALMDQETLAGIGNVYSDEILFRARIHPSTPVTALSKTHYKTLFTAMQTVLKKAIDKQAEPDRMPKSYLLPHREEGAECPVCGGTIVRRKFSGRGAYLCEDHQEKLT
jgi:formamidopyrimidine-DNA glycosylase